MSEVWGIRTFAAITSRCARFCERSCLVDGNLSQITGAVPRALSMTEGLWYVIK